MNYRLFAASVCALVVMTTTACAETILSFTDFESFTTGASVNGQGGWSATGGFLDESVVNFSGNNVWRVSNAGTAGSFGDQPFAPRPGGIPTNTMTDPVNSMPNSFAGESITGASNSRFFASFDFRSATGAPQNGLSVTVSGDNGSGGRQSFIDLEDNGGAGIDIQTFDLDSTGNFLGPIQIATGLSRNEFHNVGIEVLFVDGADNDVVNYYVNGVLVHSGQSWEQFYTFVQPTQHPLGVPIQTLLFRVSGTAAPTTQGGGFFIDNVTTAVGPAAAVPEPASMAMWMLLGVGGVGYGFRRWRRRG